MNSPSPRFTLGVTFALSFVIVLLFLLALTALPE